MTHPYLGAGPEAKGTKSFLCTLCWGNGVDMSPLQLTHSNSATIDYVVASAYTSYLTSHHHMPSFAEYYTELLHKSLVDENR